MMIGKVKKILIIGGLGFIGKNTYKYFKNKGFDVTILATKLDETSDGFLDESVRKDIILGTFLDQSFLKEIISGYNVVFSLAGNSGASASIESPFIDLELNLTGHLNLLEACRTRNSQVHIVFPSTRLVYGKPVYSQVDEKHPINPDSIYAIHKYTAEQYYLLYSKLYGIKCSILRISNPYGPYQKFADNHRYGILNWFIYKALNNIPIEIFGRGDQLRDFLFIDDLASLFEKLIDIETEDNKVFNVGSGSGISIMQAVDTIKSMIPKTVISYKEWPVIEGKIETGDYISNIGLIKSVIKWQPQVAFTEGVQRTIKFYQKFVR
jgi:nucleoside-diphosphate-sugar epimerase